MKTLSELTSIFAKTTNKAKKTPKIELLTARLQSGRRTARHAVYEVDVFNFLFDNKAALGIESLIKFTNLVIDGEVVLATEAHLAVEIKLRMNWLKQCQSEWQFRHFLETPEAKKNPVDGAIVFFEEFSGDWNKKAKKATNLWGWEAWYLHSWHCIEGKPMTLLRLCKGELQGYP